MTRLAALPFSLLALACTVAAGCAPVRGTPEIAGDAPLQISGGDDPDAQFAFYGARLELDGDDRTWDEGDQGTVIVTVVETWGEDHMAYPSVQAYADHAGVSALDAGTHQFYGMFANQEMELPFRYDAKSVAAGDEATLTITMSALGCPTDPMCPDPNPLDVSVIFGAYLPEEP